MTAELKKSTEQKMQKSLDALKSDLGKIRTGRAHTGILDHVQVDYYGSMVPINQVANLTLIDARTIGVQAYEKPMVAKVDEVMGACSVMAMRINIWPLTCGSSPIAVTLPTGTPLKRTEACGCSPVTALLLVSSKTRN